MDREITIVVSDDDAKHVQERLDRGEYRSVSDIFRAGLRRLAHDDETHEASLDTIRAKLTASLEDPRPDLSAGEMRARLDELYQRALIEQARRDGVDGQA